MEIETTGGREGDGGELDFSEHTCFLWHHMHVLRNSKTELKLEKQELSKPSFSSAVSHQTC